MNSRYSMHASIRTTSPTIWDTLVEPEKYHQWRIDSEFFRLVEAPIVLKMLRNIRFASALDIGTGTGLWANVCAMLQPRAVITGIDEARSHIDHACRVNRNGVDFQVADARSYIPTRTFELVTAGMSADYIGFMPMAQCLSRTLQDRGIGIIWYLDAKRYVLSGSSRIKRWIIDGKTVTVSIQDHDLTRVYGEFEKRNLSIDHLSSEFCLSDGIWRTMHILVVAKCRKQVAEQLGSMVGPRTSIRS